MRPLDASAPLEARIVHTFAGGELDRAAHLRADPRRIRELREAPASRYLPFRGLDPLVLPPPQSSPAWLSRDDLPARVDADAQAVFLGFA
mgnify:CR=1 FL=1